MNKSDKCPRCGKMVSVSFRGLIHRHMAKKGVVCDASGRYIVHLEAESAIKNVKPESEPRS